MIETDSPFLICGGGIGGLSAALSLHHFGLSAIVLEQAEAFTEAGAGIQLAPNAMRVLIALGLGEALEAQASFPDSIEWREGDKGRPLVSVPLADAERRWGAPYAVIHRADLIGILSAAVQARMPEALHMGQTLVGCRNTAHEAVAEMKNGEEYTAPLLIGADGHDSRVRRCLDGPQALAGAEYCAWRALLPAETLAPEFPAHPCLWTGAGRHIVTYRLREGACLNFVALVPASEAKQDSRPVAARELLKAFPGWDSRLGELIVQAGEFQSRNVYERAAPKRWYKDRLLLLGDACHTLLPFMAQGAAMAIEDAWVLAACLAANRDEMAQSLRLYQSKREARVSYIAARSRRQAGLYHAAGPVRAALHAGIYCAGQMAPGLVSARMDPIFATDIMASGLHPEGKPL